MPRALLVVATAVLALGACLPRAETGPTPAPPAPHQTLIQAETMAQPPEGDVSLPNLPTRPGTTTRSAEGLVPGAEGGQLAVLSVSPAQGADGSYGYAELGLGCRDGAAVLALAAPGGGLTAGARWFSGGAEGRLALTALDGRLVGPAAGLLDLAGRRVELQAETATAHVVAAQFELSEIRAALARLPCG